MNNNNIISALNKNKGNVQEEKSLKVPKNKYDKARYKIRNVYEDF